MKIVTISPHSRADNPAGASFSLLAPPSKSHSIRAIIFASMAEGESTLHRVLSSPDTRAAIDACRAIGARICVDGDTMLITGVAGQPHTPEQVIDVGNSGLVLRFMSALATLSSGYSVFTGDHSIRFNRPMQPLLDGLTQLGATSVSTKGDGFAPVVMKGPLHAGHALIADGRDSQPISALLIAASFLEGTTTLRVEHPGEEPWIDMTLDWLKRRGVACQHQDYRAYQITGAPIFPAFDYTVPGDFSSIAFPVVAALLSGITLNIHGLDHQDVQGDKKIVEVLRTMGACVQEEGDALIIMPSPPLTGAVIDANDMIDAVPILAVLGCFCTGPLRLIHASNARHKESNRLVAMVEALSSMGARIQETDDGLLIHPSSLKGATLSSHRDHRVAMACAVAAWHAEGPSVVLDIDCIQKTYAPFFDEMAMLGFQSEIAVKE